MEMRTFLALVKAMRVHQKEFFFKSAPDRRPNLVMICKRAERRVDEAIEEMSGGQRGLFDKRECDE